MSNGLDALTIGIICVCIALGYIFTAPVGWLAFGILFILMGVAMMIGSVIRERKRQKDN